MLVAWALASGLLVRLLATGEVAAAAGIVVAGALAPLIALACGCWSGGGRLFEACFVVAWYLGPINRQPGLDLLATTDASVVARAPAWAAVAAGGCYLVALAGRRQQLERA